MDEVRGERLHPLFLLTGLGKTIRGAWGLAVGGAYLALQGRLGLAVAVLAGFAALSMVSLLLKWLKLEYRVGADEIRIDSGLLSKTSRAIPFDRVTDIDIEQGPVHRLFGLARVRFETGASASSKSEDGLLDTISLERAEQLREYVRARRRGSAKEVVADIAVEITPVEVPVYAMSLKRILTAGVFNFSLTVLAALFGLTQTLGDVIGFDPFKRAFWENMFERSGPLRDLILGHQIASAIAGAILLGLLGMATGVVRTLLREYGFRLDRTESGFRRRRGLLTLTDVSIPQRRVQATILSTGPVRRHFGWWVLKLQSLAQDGGQGDHVVAPLATMDEARDIEASIDFPTHANAGAWVPISKGYFMSMVPIFIPATLLAIVGYLFADSSLPILWLAGAAIAIAVRYGAWRRTRYALDDGHLFIERGWWRQQRLVLPVRKIQSIDLRESFWTRWFGSCSLQLGVAGGRAIDLHSVPALSRDAAESLRARLLPA